MNPLLASDAKETGAVSPVVNILLDRDGTLVEDRGYLGDPSGIVLLPGVVSALRAFIDNGCRLYMVTNQSGIGRGFFSRADYVRVQRRLHRMLQEQGITFAGTAFCPHAPEEGCSCRKPRPGLWRELAAKHRLDPARSVMIGDKMSDVRFGANVSLAASILVLTGQGFAEAKRSGWPTPEHSSLQLLAAASSPSSRRIVARNLPAAADWLQTHHFHIDP